MNFLRKLFGSAEVRPEDEKQDRLARDFDVLKYDGVAAMKQQALDYAIRCFTHALDIRDDGETRDYLAHALIQHGDLRAAYGQLAHLADMEPMNVRVWLRMADVAYMMEDYQAMAEACERASEIDGENVDVCYAYARACIGREDFVNAIALLSKAVNLSQDSPFWDAYLLRGQTLLRMGDVETAERDADTLLASVPGSEEVQLLKARCTEARGDHAAALDHYGQAITANPFCTDAFKERAAIRRTMGDEGGAAQDEAMLAELLQGGEVARVEGSAGSGMETQAAGGSRQTAPMG